MDNNKETLDNILNHMNISGSGYDLLRYFCLPDLLGKDTNTIIYVMGKNLARELQLKTIDEIRTFFSNVGWGDLTLIKEKRNELIFELTGNTIHQRTNANITQEYRLEAGFLAQSIQQLKDLPCECMDELKKRKQAVQFHVIYSK